MAAQRRDFLAGKEIQPLAFAAEKHPQNTTDGEHIR